METNVGNVDRALRAAFGLLILSLYFWGPQTQWALLGLIPLGTAVFRFCPAYTLLGIKT